MKKNILLFNKPYNQKVYGISTALKGYKLCWHLNNVIGIDFKRTENLWPDSEKNNSFTTFKSINEEYENLIVIKNELQGKFYSAKHKVADFFVIHQKDQSKIEIENLKQTIQKISQVVAIFDIDCSKPKDAELFMLE